MGSHPLHSEMPEGGEREKQSGPRQGPGQGIPRAGIGQGDKGHPRGPSLLGGSDATSGGGL